MLVGPFRMYFVKKGVKWDLVDVHSLQLAADATTEPPSPPNFPRIFGA